MSLYYELQDAILSGNYDLAEKIKHKIEMIGRNAEQDESIIRELVEKKKKLGYELRKILDNDIESLNGVECMKACCSLLNHNLIESEMRGNDIFEYPVRELYVILGVFINEGLNDGKVKFKEFINSRYKKFL